MWKKFSSASGVDGKMKESVFVRHPQLATLRGLVPEEVVEREVTAHEMEFMRWREEATKKIPASKLCDIFPRELENGSIHLENFLGHWGNVGIEPLCKIALIAAYFKPTTVFEFGTYNGMTTLQLALNTPDDTKIYTLDLAPEHVNRTKYALTELDKYVAGDLRQKFRTDIGSYFKDSPSRSKIVQVLGDSATLDYSPYYGKIDFIFIDAAHDYNNKKSDSEHAFKMVSRNGIILWDNYDDVLNPGVTQYLSELADQRKLYRLRGTPLVIYWNRDEI
jgi:predicted O-methyltransferase YrrM